jgi:hypothetical protein
MEFEETPPTLKDKVLKFVVFIFVSILMLMLVITFIQGDDSKNYIIQVLTGQDKSAAGKIAGEVISQDYYKAAKLECNYLFKQRFPSLADDPSTLNNCAYNKIKIYKIDKILGNAVGFRTSELSIKQEISDEARRIHKETKVSAGYSIEEQRSVDDLYKAILTSVPINYRKDAQVSERLIESFLYSNVKETENEKMVKSELQSVKLSLSYISFSDEDLAKLVGSNFEVTEDEIKKDYDEAIKNKTAPIMADGKTEPLDSRKPFLLNKIRNEKKEKKIAELKAKILTTKSDANATLSTISVISNSNIQSLNQIPFSKIETKDAKSALPSFVSSSGFLRDMTKTSFGKGRISGPYTDKNQTIYVEFKDIQFASAPKIEEKTSTPDINQNRIRNILYEIKQSLSGSYPIERPKEIATVE